MGTRKSYSGGAVETTLNGAISNVATTATLTDGSTYPTTTGGPFVIVVDPGTSVEEKILVGTRAANALSALSRGYDGTTAVAHNSGAIVRHVLDAVTVDEANAHANNNTDDVHTQYLKESDVAALATDTEVAASSLAAFPVGVITPYAGAAAPTNWLLCDGAAVSRATYSALFTLVSTTYGVGDGSTTFNLPNLKGRIPVGIDAAQAEFDTRAETGGAKTHALSTAELAAHTHTVPDHNHDLFVATNAASGTAVATPIGGGSPVSGRVGGGATGLVSGSNGSGTAHNNLQPYIALHYIIKAL